MVFCQNQTKYKQRNKASLWEISVVLVTRRESRRKGELANLRCALHLLQPRTPESPVWRWAGFGEAGWPQGEDEPRSEVEWQDLPKALPFRAMCFNCFSPSLAQPRALSRGTVQESCTAFWTPASISPKSPGEGNCGCLSSCMWPHQNNPSIAFQLPVAGHLPPLFADRTCIKREAQPGVMSGRKGLTKSQHLTLESSCGKR